MSIKGPDNLAVSKILDTLGGNLELLKELRADHDELVAKNRTEEYSTDAKTAINDTISVASFMQEKRVHLEQKLWDGTITDEELEILKPDYFSFQESLAQKSLQELDEKLRTEKLSQVTMVYSIDEDSKFIRGYLSNGKQLNANDEDDKKIIDILDQSFHSWLLRNNLVSLDGVIYKHEKYKSGKPTKKANPEKVSELLLDAEKGLAKKQESSFPLQVKAYQAKKAAAKNPQSEGPKAESPQTSAGG